MRQWTTIWFSKARINLTSKNKRLAKLSSRCLQDNLRCSLCRWARLDILKWVSTMHIGAFSFSSWFLLSTLFRDLPFNLCLPSKLRTRKKITTLISILELMFLISPTRITQWWLEIHSLSFMPSWYCSRDLLQTSGTGKCSSAEVASDGAPVCIWVGLHTHSKSSGF